MQKFMHFVNITELSQRRNRFVRKYDLLCLTNAVRSAIIDFVFKQLFADVAELADAPDLGSGVPDVQVRFLSSAPSTVRIDRQSEQLL